MYYHEALAQALHDQQVTDMFGVLGDANLFFVERWARDGGRYVACAHEGSAVLAATGYASTSGGVGIATITHGPALTNAVTALVDASRARMPIVVLAGDTDPAARGHLQDIDQASVVAVTGAAFERASSPGTVAEDLARALWRARAESRPVVLNLPITFQWQQIDAPALAPVVTEVRRPRPHPEDLEDVVAALVGAQRPIVLGGRGARDARDELVALAERLGAPLATTLRGKGLFAGHPHDLGIFGTLAHPVALGVVDRADLVIAFGAGLNQFTTAEGGLIEGKRVVQIDADPARHRRRNAADIAVAADAAHTAADLLALLDEVGHRASGFADEALATALKSPRSPLPAPVGDRVEPVAALRRLDEAFPRDRTLVIDDGRFILTAYAELGAPHPQAYVHTCSFASIGLGLANAIGAQAGAPDRPVLAVVGDGGFMSAGLNELNTAVRSGQQLVVVIVNDRAYGAEHIQLVQREMDPQITCFDWPDFAEVATSLGARGISVRTMEDLEHALDEVAQPEGVVLIDLVVDPYDVPGAFV